MKRLISLLLCVTLLAAAFTVRADAEELRFYQVRINAGNGVKTEKAILADNEIYIPADSFEKYTRFQYDSERGVFLVQGQEYDKAFKIVAVDAEAKCVKVGTKKIELADCFGHGDNPYLPLCQMLPILNAQIIAVDGGVIQIVNNDLSLAELLYDFDLNEYLFNPSEEFFGDVDNAYDYIVSSYVYDTIIEGRFDRIFVFNTGLCVDYQEIMADYLSDDQVYYDAKNEENHAGELLESITGLNSAIEPLNDVYEWFEDVEKVEGAEKIVDFLKSSKGSDVFDDDLHAWVDAVHGEMIDLDHGLDVSLAEVIEGVSWIYSYATQVEDHRNMLDAVYGISDYEESLAPGASSQLGDVDPEFLAAQKIYETYNDDILDAVGKKCAQIAVEKVVEAAIEKTTAGFFLMTVGLVGELIELYWDGDSGERALLMHHVNIMDTARRAAETAWEDRESAEDYRLSLLLALMASRAAYQTMAENGNGYEQYRDRYQERIRTIEAMMMGLYLAAENEGFDDYKNYEPFAQKNLTVLKDSGLMNELVEYGLAQQLTPMVEYGILLGALDDAGMEALTWDLADGNNDGVDELYIEGNSGSLENSQLFFDANSDYLWSYTETGVAGSASWMGFAGESGYVFQRSYDTIGTQSQSYNAWHDNGWENLAEYGRLQNESGDYTGKYHWLGEAVTFEAFLDLQADAVFACAMNDPALLTMEFSESAGQVCAVLDGHFQNRGDLLQAMDQDLDGDGVTEHLYLIDGAANRILDRMEVSNAWGDERHLSYEDEALTIVSVEDQGVLTAVRIIRSEHYDLSNGALLLYDDLVTISKTICTCGGDSDECVFEIPQINLESDEINAINAKILNDYADLIHDCDAVDEYFYPVYWNVDVDYAVEGDILSMVIEGQFFDWPDSDYSIYNISLSEKALVSNERLFASAGMTEAECRTHIKQALGSVFWDFCGFLSELNPGDYSLDEWFAHDRMLQNTIGAENIDATKLFLGVNGDLWAVGDVYVPAGGGVMTVTVNLNDYEVSPNYAESLNYEKPEELMRIELTWDGKDDDGYLLYLGADLTGTMDDGSWVDINDWSVTYDQEGQPVAYAARSSTDTEGSVTYHLYRLVGELSFEVSVKEGAADFYGMIQESGVKATVTYPDGRIFTYTLDEGMYKSYTGHWFWAPFAIDHGVLTEYDDSWLQTGGW